MAYLVSKNCFCGRLNETLGDLVEEYSMDPVGVIHGGSKISVLRQENRSLLRKGTSKFARMA